MVSKVTSPLMLVEPGQTVELPRRDIQTLHSVDHALWVTQEGCARDWVISGGQCVTLHGRGRVIVQALNRRAHFRVQSTPSWSERWRGRLAALIGRNDGLCSGSKVV